MWVVKQASYLQALTLIEMLILIKAYHNLIHKSVLSPNT